MKRLNSYRRGYNKKWNRYSKAYRRANPWCVKCLPKLTAAECVDHKKPISGRDDPLFWKEDNHQSLCWSCHSIKTAIEDGGGWQNGGSIAHPQWIPKPGCKVTVVCGPAGSGKSTHVKSNAQPQDIVIDLDECLYRVSGLYGSEAPIKYLTQATRLRNSQLAALEQHRGQAWFIVGAPTKAERTWWADTLSADIKLMDVSEMICRQRIAKDTPRKGRLDASRIWFEKSKTTWKPQHGKAKTGLDGWPENCSQVK